VRTLLRVCAPAVVAVLAALGAPAGAGDELAGQIELLTNGMRQLLDQERPGWTIDRRTTYTDACREALDQYLVQPLTPADLEIIRAGQQHWGQDCLPPFVPYRSLQSHLDTLDYAVSQMFRRPHPRPTESEQGKIDSQIDLFCDRLEPTLSRYFLKYSSKAALTGAAEEIRSSLKRSSRNPWFPALKEPLDPKEEREIQTRIVDDTLRSQLHRFKKAKAEGKEVNFDWGMTSAWSAATKFVSKTINLPSDCMIMVSHSPDMPSIGIQVKSFAAAPTAPRADEDLPGQIETVATEMRRALDKNRSDWMGRQRAKYTEACQDALQKHLAEPFTSNELKIVRAGLWNWTEDNLTESPPMHSFPYQVDALKYAVEKMVDRDEIRPTEEQQREIDRQINAFSRFLKAALLEHYTKYSDEETLVQTVKEMRNSLKASSRNPWFPALKEPLSPEEKRKMKSEIVDQTLLTQLANFEKAREEGKELRFDWGVTSAWSAATKFVSRTIKPPSDRMIMFTHSPGMPSIGVQVRPPMMGPPAG